jgi:hypothetical protein
MSEKLALALQEKSFFVSMDQWIRKISDGLSVMVNRQGENSYRTVHEKGINGASTETFFQKKATGTQVGGRDLVVP